jgi:hypothetical protein
LLLQLAQFSINNVISRLKIANGIPPSNCKFLRPDSDEDFSRPWSHSTGVTSMSFNLGLNEAVIPAWNKAELLQRIQEARGQGPIP